MPGFLGWEMWMVAICICCLHAKQMVIMSHSEIEDIRFALSIDEVNGGAQPLSQPPLWLQDWETTLHTHDSCNTATSPQ